MTDSFIENLNWRFAAKDFDPEKSVSDDDLSTLLNAIQLTPTSYGLEPFHVVVVSDPELKLKLQEKGYNQPQFKNSSHVLVFCRRMDLDGRIDTYLDELTGGDAEKREAMKGFEDILNGFSEGKSTEEIRDWADRQTYLALGFGLAACAALKIDSCPMEGFVPPDFDQLLELPEHIKSVACLAIGYRSHDPKRPKFRFNQADLFTKK
jgi:nitroreductase / dihydropteridine reductase